MSNWDKAFGKKPGQGPYKRKLEVVVKDSQTKQTFSFTIEGTPLQWQQNSDELRRMAHERFDCVLDRCAGIGVGHDHSNLSADAAGD